MLEQFLWKRAILLLTPKLTIGRRRVRVVRGGHGHEGHARCSFQLLLLLLWISLGICTIPKSRRSFVNPLFVTDQGETLELGKVQMGVVESL